MAGTRDVRRLSKKPSADFPKLDLEVLRLRDDERVVVSSGDPLTEKDATKIVIAYRIVQQLIARTSERIDLSAAD
jgi:hypothetical protein